MADEPTRVEQLGFWDRLGLDEAGMPVHLPMPLTADGHGPADPDAADHLSCWCSDPECMLARAFSEAFELGRASREGVVDAEQIRAVLRLIGDEHITPIGRRQIEKVLDA